VWLCDCVTMWLCDCVTVWLCDCVTVWLCDCVTVWLCDWCKLHSDATTRAHNVNDLCNVCLYTYFIHSRIMLCNMHHLNLNHHAYLTTAMVMEIILLHYCTRYAPHCWRLPSSPIRWECRTFPYVALPITGSQHKIYMNIHLLPSVAAMDVFNSG